MSIEMWLSGFLFLFILVVYLIFLPALGYKVEIRDLDALLIKKRKELNRKYPK